MMSSIHLVQLCLTLFIILNLNFSRGTLFGIKNEGNIGYYNSNLEWVSLDSSNKLRAKYVNGNENGLFYIKQKFYTFYTQSASTNDKFKSMKKEFISVVINHENYIYGLTQNGNLYQCGQPCNTENIKEKWIQITQLPERIEIENDLPSRIVNPRYQGKLIEISSSAQFPLLAIDEIGKLWMYQESNNQWVKIETSFAIKSIELSKSGLLFVVSNQDGKAYQSSLAKLIQNNENNENNENEQLWKSVGPDDATDFDRVLIDQDSNRIFAINYYSQLFRLDAQSNDWHFVDENVKIISCGLLPSFAEQGKKEL